MPSERSDTFARVGTAGVDVFFVISGFIMATIAAGKTPTEFMADRIWRIFPIWLVAVSPWLIGGHLDRPTLLASLTLWPMWGHGFSSPALLLGWSLCFEMLFYWSFALALATRGFVPLSVFIVCLLAWRTNELLAFLGSPLILEFLAGVVIAQLKPSRFGLVLIGLGLLWLACAPVDYYAEVWRSGAFHRIAAWGVPAVLIVYGARSLESGFGHRFFGPFVLLGDASYSIYLFHFIPVKLVGAHWALAFVAGIAAGLVAWVLIERPMLQLKPRMAERRRGPAPVPAE